jgi:hypothetical protein
MRFRADRGSIKTVMRGAQRRVPRSELERTGLLPDEESRNMRQQIADLQRQLSEHRRLVAARTRGGQTTDAGRGRATSASRRGGNRERAGRTELEGRLHRLENEIAAAGPMRACRLGVQIGRARPDLVYPRPAGTQPSVCVNRPDWFVGRRHGGGRCRAPARRPPPRRRPASRSVARARVSSRRADQTHPETGAAPPPRRGPDYLGDRPRELRARGAHDQARRDIDAPKATSPTPTSTPSPPPAALIRRRPAQDSAGDPCHLNGTSPAF